MDTSGGVEFVQSWDEPVRGTDYTYTFTEADLDVVLERGALTLGIQHSQPVSHSADVHLSASIRGEPFGLNIKERIDVRSQASIDAYGPRPVIYPADLLTDVAEVRDHLNWAVKLHDGINSCRGERPERSAKP